MDYNFDVAELTTLVTSVENKLGLLTTPLSEASQSFLDKSTELMGLVERLNNLELFEVFDFGGNPQIFKIFFTSISGQELYLLYNNSGSFVVEDVSIDGYRTCNTVEEEFTQQAVAAELIKTVSSIDRINI